MGAQRAAWMVAFRAEAAGFDDMTYGQTLLDLVKAFEKMPHDRGVAAAARKHWYNMFLLRLTLAAYRHPRSIGVDGVYSRLVIAVCSITAGSGSLPRSCNSCSSTSSTTHIRSGLLWALQFMSTILRSMLLAPASAQRAQLQEQLILSLIGCAPWAWRFRRKSQSLLAPISSSPSRSPESHALASCEERVRPSYLELLLEEAGGVPLVHWPCDYLHFEKRFPEFIP